MSRAHFELKPAREADVIRLRDLGSKNGTYVDGRPARQAFLQDGAVIRSGDTLFAFVERPAPMGDPPLVPPGRSSRSTNERERHPTDDTSPKNQRAR